MPPPSKRGREGGDDVEKYANVLDKETAKRWRRDDYWVEWEVGEIEEEEQKFIAGFFDGDGSVNVQRGGSGSWSLSVTFAQSRDAGVPPELERMWQYFGGAISKQEPRSDQQRIPWVLDIGDRLEKLMLLEIVAKHGVMKRSRALIGLQLLRKELGGPDAQAAIRKEREDTLFLSPDPSKFPSMLSAAYLAGLFTAEGGVGLACATSVGLYVDISQKSCPEFLMVLASVLGGSATDSTWRSATEDGLRFLRDIRPYLDGQKTPQVDLTFEFRSRVAKNGWDLPGHRNSEEKRKYIIETDKKLKMLKRT